MSSITQSSLHRFPKIFAEVNRGALLFGRFEVQRCLGSGASGVVYRCRDNSLTGQIVAVKLFPVAIVGDQVAAARVNREIRAAYRIDHRNVARFFDVLKDESFVAIVMEYSDGGTLQDVMDTGAAMAIQEIVDNLIQICAGLESIHEAGIIHRDLKPANLLFCTNGLIKITDFGLSRAFSESMNDRGSYSDMPIRPPVNMPKERSLTDHQSFVGTPVYASPEYVSTGQLDKRSDIYSLGVVAYEMLTGACPFSNAKIEQLLQLKVEQDPSPPHSLNRDCPIDLSTVVMNMLQRDPEARYQEVRDVSMELRQFWQSTIEAHAPQEDDDRALALRLRKSGNLKSAPVRPKAQIIVGMNEETENSRMRGFFEAVLSAFSSSFGQRTVYTISIFVIIFFYFVEHAQPRSPLHEVKNWIHSQINQPFFSQR